MKKVLVTGASGSIGIYILKYLLSEGKYEITALDLRNKKSYKKLKKYRRRINIIYGDITDSVLMDALVKDHDYIIHLAGVMPPMADIKKSLGDLIDYQGTNCIVKSINRYNPECFLLYASSTTVYGEVKEAKVGDKLKISDIDYYSHTKEKIEKLITNKLKNYKIFRLPLVLCNPKSNAFMYNVKKDTYLEAITDNDAAYMFVSALNNLEKLDENIYNVGGGTATTGYYRDILINVLKIYGLSLNYLFVLLFADKNFYCHTYKDSDILETKLEFRSDSLSSYYMRLKRTTKNRKIAQILAIPFISILKRNKK